MHSNVDPHGVRLRACVHSRTAAGSWPKAAVTLSLNPLLPCWPADQPWHRTVGSAQHVVIEAEQLWTAARWHWMAGYQLLLIVNLNVCFIRNNFYMLLPI